MSSLWLKTTAYSNTVGTSPAYLPAEHKLRADRLRALRCLYDGRHREFFLDAENTQFDFRPVRINGRLLPIFITMNILSLISRKHADLLFGEKPSIRVADPGMQGLIDETAIRSSLHQQLSAAAVEQSWAGETCLEIVRDGAEIYIIHTSAEEIFPVGGRRASGQYGSYIRYATAQVQTGGKLHRTLLLETRYTAGAITRTCHELKDGARADRVEMSLWPVIQADGSPLLDQESTGLSVPSIVWIPNELDGNRPISDYDGAIDLQDELNAKQTQIARVLAKHADPKMFFSSGSADNDGNIRATDDAFIGDSPEAKPEYITWQSELANAIEDRKFTLNALCMVTEMSQVLLGLKDGAAPDAARKLRLEATNSLAKASRKALYWQPAIRLAMSLALKAQGVAAAVPISVEMRDGLPVDEQDRAQEIATLRGAGVLSKRRALEKQNLEPAAVEKELDQLAEEASAATPSIFFGERNEQTTDAPAEAAA